MINRGNHRGTIFPQPADCETFLVLMADAAEHAAVDVIGFALMKNHFHLVIWPRERTALSTYMHRLTSAHVHYHHARYGTTGMGHLYQGRYKNFVVQDEAYLVDVLRYVEANPVRASLVESADDWQWSSFTRSCASDGRRIVTPSLVTRPANWLDVVNAPLPSADLLALRASVRRSRPYGDARWLERMVATYHLEHTIRNVGRPAHLVETVAGE